MSQGKYSPNLPKNDNFEFNCYGQKPAAWNKQVAEAGVVYDEKTMFANYDSEGFDRYGYSCFDAAGNYVGQGDGVDRNGYTEFDYFMLSGDEFDDLSLA